MTLSQMPSPLTDGTPSTNVPTHKGCMCGSIFTSGVFADWVFDAALVFRLGFDEDSARSAVLRQVVEKRLKRLCKPLSMPISRFLEIRLVLRLGCIKIGLMLRRQMIVFQRDVVRVCDSHDISRRKATKDGVSHVARDIG